METIQGILNRDIGPELYDRKTKNITREREPFIKGWLRREILYDTPLQKIDETYALQKVIRSENIHNARYERTEDSVKEIPKFIEFYEIDMKEFIKENPCEYKTFNDFFIRELKEGARPVVEADNNNVIVSAADCRLSVFDSLYDARNLLIKAKKFSLEKLVNNRMDLVDRFRNGCVANFRLCPQDYHRYHSPIAGTVIESYEIPGMCYATEPVALRSDVNVLGENERTVIVIESANGKFSMLYIAIGAESVGRVNTLVKEGQKLKKGDEIGYFDFGGSDIFVMFDRPIKWDDDIRSYSEKGIETLLLVNDRIGELLA